MRASLHSYETAVDGGASQSRVLPVWGVLASYFAVFGVLGGPILRVAATALPELPNAYDSHLITWILSWTTHAFATDPRGVFDANIAHPAPGQLTGSEHLFAVQVVFAPLRLLGCNPVLATNLTAFLVYPLAAFAMERLLRALGFTAAVAWVVGLWFALAPHSAQFNVHVLQYPHLWLPWTALRVTRLREDPGARSAALLALAYGLAIFTSYYSAVLVSLTAAVWAALELCRRRPGRWRFLAWGVVAAALPTLLLALAMTPYLVRSVKSYAFLQVSEPTLGSILVDLTPFEITWIAYRVPMTWLETALALIGIAGALGSSRPLGAVLARGIATSGVGAFLRNGVPSALAPILAASPLRSFRYVHRLALVVVFGRALLWAAGLQTIVDWSRPRKRWLAPTIVAGAVAGFLGLGFASVPMLPVRALLHRSIYDRVAAVWAENGRGALLELPVRGRLPGLTQRLSDVSLEPDAMVASTLHWWPTLGAYTGYHAAHREVLLRVLARLPDPAAVDDLADMTHVRWLLVRPAEYWNAAEERARFLERLRQAPAIGRTFTFDGWILFQVDRDLGHPRWFEAIASGDRPAQSTVLGTPLAALDPVRARGRVDLVRASPPRTGVVTVDVEVRNEGDLPWPAVPFGPPLQLDAPSPKRRVAPFQVVLTAEWKPIDERGEIGAVVHREVLSLDRDVDPGDRLQRSLSLEVPAAAGRYELEVSLQQIDGPRLDAPGQANRATVVVKPEAAKLERAG